MFSFQKKLQEKLEPELNNRSDEPEAEEKKLADILGAQEYDTNITAGVDAILDDEAEIGEDRMGLGRDSIDFGLLNDSEMSEPTDGTFYQNADSFTEDSGSSYSQDATSSEADVYFEEPLYTGEDFASQNISEEDNSQTPFFENSVSDIQADTVMENNEQQNDAVMSEDHFVFDESIPQEQFSVSEDLSSIVDDILVGGAENILAEDDISALIPDEADELVAENISANEGVVEEVSVTDVSAESLSAAKVDEVITSAVPVAEESSGETVHLTAQVLWENVPLAELSETPKVFNSNTRTEHWGGDKYQQDIKIDLETVSEAEKWSLTLIHHYTVPLKSKTAELAIDKDDNTVRYASLIHNGEEKLKIFDQQTYKFVMPQGDFFTVQGNVICGRIDETFSLEVQDFITVPLCDKFNQCLKFKQPMSGFLIGADGARVYFADVRALAVCVREETEADVIEYIPSLKGLDDRSCFVYDENESDGTQELSGNGRQKCLVINVGSSLYGWNVRFDNGMHLSLRDVLEYQSRYKKLPSPNGEVVHGKNILRFYEIEKLQAREKTIYYSYGKM